MSEEITTGNPYTDSTAKIGDSEYRVPEFRLKFINLLNNEGNENTNLNKDANIKGNNNLEKSFNERTASDWQYERLSDKNKNIIKSNVDGGTEYTNIQDKNTDDWSNEDSWAIYGSILGGSATNALGVTNSDISDLGSIISDISSMITKKSNESNFDKRMSKINEWKNKTYKSLHPFDWKPGQTIPQDLMDTSAGSLANDMIEMFGSQEFKNGYRKGIKYVSPDPIKYARDSIKSSKGIDPNQEVFKIQSEEVELYKDTSAKNFSGYNRSPEETKFINALKNKNTFNKTLGYIYIKPKYDYNNNEMMQIPFEFNPEISGDGNQASYVSETLLNRIGQFHVYTGTNLSQLSVSLKYIALSPDYTDEKDIAKQFSTDIWQYYWTNSRIESIEYQLRSLVFPDVTSADYLIRPPLIELHLGNEDGIENVGDLYKYPINLNSVSDDDKKYLSVTRSINGEVNRYKKYIVTNVQIDPINEDSYMWPSYYGRVWDDNSKSGSLINHISKIESEKDGKIIPFTGTRRTGFRATLQLLEVTENFLDIVPDFKAYYNAWTKKKEIANRSYENATFLLGGEFANRLDTELLTSVKTLDDVKKELSNLFIEAYNFASLYKEANNKDSSIGKMNNAMIGSKSESDPYYYVNKKWFYNKDKEIKEDEASDMDKDPIFFNVLLKGEFDRFINSKETLPLAEGEKQNAYSKKYTDEDLIGKDIGNAEKEKINGIPKTAIDLEESDFGMTDNNYPDYLGLFYHKEESEYNKTGYSKKGKLSYIFQETSNVNKYTDAECFLIIKRMIDISDTLKKESEAIQIENSDLKKHAINDFKVRSNHYLETGLKDIEKKDTDFCINFNYSDVVLDGDSGYNIDEEYKKRVKSIIGEDEIYSLIYEDGNYIDNEIIFVRKSNLFIKKYIESILHIQNSDGSYKLSDNAKKLVEDTKNEKYNNDIFLCFKNEINQEDGNPSLLEEAFDHIKKLVDDYKPGSKEEEKDIKKSKYKINSFVKKMEKRCLDCFDLIVNYYDYLNSVVTYNGSYNKCIKDVGEYLSLSILCGDNLKCIKKMDKKNVKVKYTHYKDENNNYKGKSETCSKEVKDVYETYIKDEGITILNVRKMTDAIVEGLNNALKELKPIEEKLNKTPLVKQVPDFEKISFNKDKETYIGNQKDNIKKLNSYEKTLRNDLLINFGVGDTRDVYTSSNSIENLLEYILYLKKNLNCNNIENNFHKIAGKSEKKDDQPQNAGVIGLEPLKDKYKEYSKNENALREKVFKEWDEIQTFASADSLINNGKFETELKKISNGEIPNKYRDILEKEINMKSLNIASNNIDAYKKLSE